MKQFLPLVLIVLLSATQVQAITTQDTIYFWKTGTLLLKQSIKASDLDSITFKRPLAVNIPQGTICTQVWAKKNLDVTTYSDGTVIPQVTDPKAWANLTTGAWCYYNNVTANGAIYGKLYNWYAAAGIYDAASAANPTLRKKLAPTGWHIPTDDEWTTLTTCLGGESIAGGKMKERGTAHWVFPNQDATNSSGFAGLPGGYRGNDGTFDYIGYNGYWWSSSDHNTTYAWNRSLNYKNSVAGRANYIYKEYGFAVRCLKD